MPKSVELYGHRGACAELPENTMASFERAVEVGVTTIESDLHLTADGVVVMSHDGSGKRMADVDKSIREHSLQEVQSWDVGYGFERRTHKGASPSRPFAGKGHHIPTLASVLDRFPTMRFNLDIKQEAPSMARVVIDLIDELGATPRVTLASFHASVLDELRAEHFGGDLVLGKRELRRLLLMPRGLLQEEAGLGHRAQVPRRYGPINFASTWFLDKSHALGIAVDFWTINGAKQALDLVRLGADGIMTDDPARLAPALRDAGYLE